MIMMTTTMTIMTMMTLMTTMTIMKIMTMMTAMTMIMEQLFFSDFFLWGVGFSTLEVPHDFISDNIDHNEIYD